MTTTTTTTTVAKTDTHPAHLGAELRDLRAERDRLALEVAALTQLPIRYLPEGEHVVMCWQGAYMTRRHYASEADAIAAVRRAAGLKPHR